MLQQGINHSNGEFCPLIFIAENKNVIGYIDLGRENPGTLKLNIKDFITSAVWNSSSQKARCSNA